MHLRSLLPSSSRSSLVLLLLSAACGGAQAPTSTTPTSASTSGVTSTGAVTPGSTRFYGENLKRPVTENYFGTNVVDNYRWLENAKDPEVIGWTDAQNKVSRTKLDAIDIRPQVRARVAELLSSRPPSFDDVHVAGDLVFAEKHQPPKQQGFIVVYSDATKETERTIIDPNTIDPSGKTAIDFFVPSRDGKKVAVSLSKGGSEAGDVHVFDVATGKELADVISHVNNGTAGGSVTWNGDGTGLYYTRYPRAGERAAEDMEFYQQLYFHKLGTPESADTYALGKDLPRIAEIKVTTSADGKDVLAAVENGDGGEYAFYATNEKGEFVQLSKFEDKFVHGEFGEDGALYLLSRKGAPKGALYRLAKPFATSKPTLLVPEGDGVIEHYAATKSRLYVSELLGGPSRLRTFRLTGGKADSPETIKIDSEIAGVQGLERIGADDVLYRSESYTAAPTWFRYSPRSKKSLKTMLAQTMPYSMADVEVVRETCTSKDGTQVPLNVVRKKGIALDGSHPALLTGYGGYGVSRTPRLRPMNRFWLDQGGVFAEANLRGGGEYGEAWHDAGKLEKKQNVFDDFYACANALVDKGYTKHDKLGAYGGSNGGLLMGAQMVQHPEAYRVIVSMVGIYDMLRVETTPNGAFNVTEFGTVKDEKLFHALYAYSPLHNVRDGVIYPSVLFTTGANDPRVDPYHSRKMLARMQAAAAGDHPILLRASADTGHGMGTPLSAEIEEATDMFSFVMNELGMPFVTK